MTASHDQQLPAAWAPGPPVPPKRGLVAAGVAGGVAAVLVLMAGTGFAVWRFTRPTPQAAATSTAAAAGPVTATGSVVLERGQFVWSGGGAVTPTCEGLQGFNDVRPGAQVAVTDSSGKTVATGSLGQGVPSGISNDGGLDRATWCTLQFTVAGVPAGAGPYGVQVAGRGVVRVDEGHLGIIRVTF